MRRSAAWLLAAGLVCLAGCQRTVAKVGIPPEAPVTGEVSAPQTSSAVAPAASGAVGATAASAAQTAPGTGVAVRPPADPEATPSTPAGIPPAGAPGDASISPEPVEPEPKPRIGKEMVIAWEASLMYLIRDGKLAGQPLILNGARRQYLRDQHLGEFKISEKMRLKRSNLYDVNGDPLRDKKTAPRSGAVMRNWMRLGKLAVGLHYSPAFRFHRSASARHRSHGCYRMSRKDSNDVFRWAPVGTPIHVVRFLGGTEWQFLVAQTPPELLPGYRGSRTAAAPAAKKTRSRSAGTRTKPPTPARQSAAGPATATPKPEPTAQPAPAEPEPKPNPQPAPAQPEPKPTAQPTAPERPAPAPPGALDSGSATRTAPAPQPHAPAQPTRP